MPSIKRFSKADLPREKLEKYGPQKLSDKELLALLLGSGIKGLNVLELSQRILKIIKRIGVAKITKGDLLKIKGLGPAKASQIVALLELSSRFYDERGTLLMSPKSVWEQCQDINSSKKEHFLVFYLDTRNQLISREIISVGTVNMSIVHPREVFEVAIKNSAVKIILAHNHPSESIEPSPDDLALTSKLTEAGRLLGVLVEDHIIVTKRAYFSFKANKLLL